MKRKRSEDDPKEVVKRFMTNKGFSQNLIKKIVNPGRKVHKYSREEICEAILLRALSPKAYEMIRENSILPLPCKSTLTSKIKHFRCAPGIQKEFFGFIKLKLSTAELWERQCILMFDEMQVSQSYEYCERLKQMFTPHKKVQVVLLR